jgi:hypothetical protein
VIGHQHGGFGGNGGGQFDRADCIELWFLPLQPRGGEH